MLIEDGYKSSSQLKVGIGTKSLKRFYHLE